GAADFSITFTLDASNTGLPSPPLVPTDSTTFGLGINFDSGGTLFLGVAGAGTGSNLVPFLRYIDATTSELRFVFASFTGIGARITMTRTGDQVTLSTPSGDGSLPIVLPAGASANALGFFASGKLKRVEFQVGRAQNRYHVAPAKPHLLQTGFQKQRVGNPVGAGACSLRGALVRRGDGNHGGSFANGQLDRPNADSSDVDADTRTPGLAPAKSDHLTYPHSYRMADVRSNSGTNNAIATPPTTNPMKIKINGSISLDTVLTSSSFVS
ncbi:MAG: hypothetical protein IIB59_00130, partial [Planctomycetes bacterium]|nr:hypothetical protein [Planctomycetota bacterium]